MHATAHVPLPDLTFRDGTPVSGQFDDVYFSRAGGVEETTHVFLHGNGLPARWRSPSPTNNARVGVAEPEGRGAGSPSSLTISCVASHGEPLAKGCGEPVPADNSCVGASRAAAHASGGMGADAPANSSRVAEGEPEGSAATPRRGESPSTHTFSILELGFGTGLNFLVTLDAFLRDAPAELHLHYIAVEQFPLTPDMLREALALYPQFHALTKALLAAYPLRLPGLHRIHLPRVTLTLGFGDASELLPQIETRVDAIYLDGFSPAKNSGMWTDALFAELARLSHAGTTLATFTSAGFVRRGLSAQGFAIQKVAGYGHKREMSIGRFTAPVARRTSAPSHTIIIGAGIAGCTLAHALATRGIRVTLLERHQLASAASGNSAGVLFPQLTKRWTHSAAWYFAGYSYMLHQIARWQAMGLSFPTAQLGMLRLPRHAQEAEQLRHLGESLGLDPAIVHWVDQPEASAVAGVPLATGAAFFPQGTWLSPAALCAALVTHPNITVQTQWDAVSLQRTDRGWCVTNAAGASLYGSHLAVTSARDTAQLLPHLPLVLNHVGGQVTEIAAADVAAPLRSILCQKGYVIPLGDRYLTGATYNHGDDSCAVTTERHTKNLEELTQILPDWHQGDAIGGRTSLRSTTPDRLPYAGLVEADLAVSAGHGSRGLISAPLAAEVIASAWCGEAAPVATALLQQVYPLRRQKQV